MLRFTAQRFPYSTDFAHRPSGSDPVLAAKRAETAKLLTHRGRGARHHDEDRPPGWAMNSALDGVA